MHSKIINKTNKYALITMDIEDYYHLDYLQNEECNKDHSFLDGVENFSKILDKNNIKSNFFVIGEIANKIKEILIKLSNKDHEIGSHGWNHKRPIEQSYKNFRNDLVKSKITIEKIINKPVIGYRAPCFSLNRERLNIVSSLGFCYDSSRINFSAHPLYNTIDLHGYSQISKNIYKKNNFFEFEVSTTNFFNKTLPISGGGYIRILPWILSKKLISSYLINTDIYIFYIHPFEMSDVKNSILNNKISELKKIRFKYGRKSVEKKFSKLIELLKANKFRFITFPNLIDLINENKT